MPGITVNLEGEGAFESDAAKVNGKFIFLEDPAIKIARLPNGTKSGKSAVGIGFEHAGQYIVIHTTLALLKTAVRAMEVRDEAEGRPT